MDCFNQECSALAEYLEGNTDNPLVKIVTSTESKKSYGIISFSTGPTKRNTLDTDKYHYNSLHKMALHGDYFKRQLAMPNVATDLSKAWLKNSYFRFETESLICAAQEQALATKYTRSKIWKQGNDTKCRLCGEHNETVHHIVSGCKMLAVNQYTFRHNQVGKYLHWWILKDLGVTVTESWLNNDPVNIIKHEDTVIMWDKAILTDKKNKL